MHEETETELLIKPETNVLPEQKAVIKIVEGLEKDDKYPGLTSFIEQDEKNNLQVKISFNPFLYNSVNFAKNPDGENKVQGLLKEIKERLEEQGLLVEKTDNGLSIRVKGQN